MTQLPFECRINPKLTMLKSEGCRARQAMIERNASNPRVSLQWAGDHPCVGCAGPIERDPAEWLSLEAEKEEEKEVDGQINASTLIDRVQPKEHGRLYACHKCRKLFEPWLNGKQTIKSVCKKCVSMKRIMTRTKGMGSKPRHDNRITISANRVLLDFTAAPVVMDYLKHLYPGKDIGQAMTEEIARSARDWLHEREILEPLGLKKSLDK